MSDKIKVGKKEKEKQIRGVFWGGSRSDVQKSEKWTSTESRDPSYLCYLGNLFGFPCHLSYCFDGSEEGKLIGLSYYFFVRDHVSDKKRFLYDSLWKVLVENYGNRAENYPNEYIWIVHDDQTFIQLKIDENGVTVSMDHNTGDIRERKIDYYKQALREL